MEIKPEQLKRSILSDQVGLPSDNEQKELEGIIGQDRAVEALQLGLQISGNGYNTYVAGPSGIGKMTSVQSYLEKEARKKTTPVDWCYVHNFKDQYEPQAIELNPGSGKIFQEEMDNLKEHVKNDIPMAFESEEYSQKREQQLSELQKRRENISKELDQKAQEKGFAVQENPMGITLIPLKDGRRMENQEFKSLSEEERKKIEQNQKDLQEEIKRIQKDVRQIERKEQESIKELDKQVVMNTLGGIVDDIKENFSGNSDVLEYIENVKNDVMENVGTFKLANQETPQNLSGQQKKQQLQLMQEELLKKYQVNVVVDNKDQKGAPVIVEYNPSYTNLVGRIEKSMKMGALTTDFTMIQPGVLLQANGGFLVVQVEDILRNPYSWEALKRALRSGEVRIEEFGEQLGLMTMKTLRPQAIRLDVKIILVGSPLFYHLLYQLDTDFHELFKVKADYDTKMSFTEENVEAFFSFLNTYRKKENLLKLEDSAGAKLLEYAVRKAEHQERISTEFGYLSDIIRESDFWAGKEESSTIKEKHVKKALDERIYRSNLVQEKILTLIEDGTICIDTRESRAGQINGLSVIDMGDYMFGRPNRITATTTPGRKGVVDIEREAQLGGPVHSKALMIISGFLSRMYGRNSPLSLSARVVFEQSYQGVEGDSASLAEVYSIISSLADLPISQEVAVTGSMNQFGDTQPIGGVNEKIEGFFEVCRIHGFTGNQGVIIPERNAQHLMLKDEVIDAVREGNFHVWKIKRLEEGFPVLTGKEAEELNRSVMDKLSQYSAVLKEMEAPKGGE
ncbi:MAG: AAA family ATPase [Spirochaetales bacterium]|nr:AAA family ATPase [Spirochaetales bacterium]MCF7936968.1 AAA family ATPase [Spirochaetales bacterium]